MKSKKGGSASNLPVIISSLLVFTEIILAFYAISTSFALFQKSFYNNIDNILSLGYNFYRESTPTLKKEGIYNENHSQP